MNQPPIPNEQRRILIVDDENLNLILLEAILHNEGYQIRQAHDGEEAVKSVLENPPDLVVMDVCMPKKDGFQACREIKASLSDNFVPVILLTNLSDTDSQVQGLDAGADGYLIKPPARDELLARVRAMLRIRDLQENLRRSKQELQKTNQKLLRAQQQIEEELQRVGSIQRSFLPDRFPYHPEFAFGCYYGPCEMAGGDYFDVIEIGKNLWGLLIADVTGHGASAAVVMAITHTLMHSYANSFHYPSTALKVANEKLNAHLAPTFYVTMFYGILNLDAMKFRFSSAGHEPMMHYRASEHRVDYLRTKHGFPLKLLESDDYDEEEVSVGLNDKIILFTDGLVEIRSREGELFGPNRLEELALKYHDLKPQPFVDAIIAEVQEFIFHQSFKDDLTLFVVQRIT
ncbi:MAG: fused response regulator/phosphatase [Candidatus Omnitrophota bacterium]|jgi:serine phosphatase RsbU (regulator of sigma subunit)|nr:MAG: fused response regulator/phosphatase [Candidatus Omnitrophota bacterium]